jgi:hypothetical protein
MIVIIGITLQYAGMLVCYPFIARRLNSKCSRYQLLTHSKTIFISCATTLVASILSTLFASYALPQGSSWVRKGWMMYSMLTMCLILSILSHFLFVDARVANDILDILRLKVIRRKHVSAADVDKVRMIVDYCVRTGYITNTVLIGVALGNVIVSLGLFVFVREPRVLFQIVTYFSKEVVLAAVGLYYAACANEKYFALVSAVGKLVESAPLDPMQTWEGQKETLQRSLVLQGLIANPIQYPLVGLVLTRKDVFFRFSLYLFSILLSGFKDSLK